VSWSPGQDFPRPLYFHVQDLSASGTTVLLKLDFRLTFTRTISDANSKTLSRENRELSCLLQVTDRMFVNHNVIIHHLISEVLEIHFRDQDNDNRKLLLLRHRHLE